MVMANTLQSCQQYSAWNSPDSNHVSALLQLRQQVNLPSFPDSSVFTANTVSPTTNQYPSESQFSIRHPAGRQAMPIDASRKTFLVFDQSGDQTRLFIGPSYCPENELLSKKTFDGYGSQHENLETLVGCSLPVKPIMEEHETHISCKGGEMHEDLEEINALLYSDSDDDDDEVTSTGHSPFMVRVSYNDHKQLRELIEDVASSGEPSKRQKLHDGQYKKSYTEIAKSAKLHISCSDEDDVESSCVKGTPNKGQENSSHMCIREKKMKIRQTLRILQSSILDLNTKDPLLVIDEAINYLKFLRLKVKEMGIELPQSHTSFPQ